MNFDYAPPGAAVPGGDFLCTYATITWQRQEPEGSCTGVGLVSFFGISVPYGGHAVFCLLLGKALI